MRTPIQIQTSSSDFPAFIQDGRYYVDKTLLVQEIVEKNRQVTIYTRPRRFGNSLNYDVFHGYAIAFCRKQCMVRCLE